MSQPLYVQKSQGLTGDPVATFLDRATLQNRAASTTTVINDGNVTTSFVTASITAKVFARGMAGQLDSIQVCLNNKAATSGTVLFGFRPFLDAEDQFYVSLTVPPSGSTGVWYPVSVRKSWNFDKLVVVVWFLSTANIGVGYDATPPWDCYNFDVINDWWLPQSVRLYIRATVSGQVTEAVPVTGSVTIKNIEEPIIGGAVVIRPTSETGHVISVERFEESPISWELVPGTPGQLHGASITRDLQNRPGDLGACLDIVTGSTGIEAFVEKNFGIRRNLVGFECAFALYTFSSNMSIEWALDVLFGSHTGLSAEFRYFYQITSAGTGKMDVWDYPSSTILASAPLQLGQGTSPTDTPIWNRMKVIVDMVNLRFVSFRINDTLLLPTSTTPAFTPIPASYDSLLAFVTVNPFNQAQGGFTAHAKIGDVVLTEEGPFNE